MVLSSHQKSRYSLQQKLWLLFIVILAISIKSVFSYYFFKLDDDKLYQAAAAKSLVEGYGITIKVAQANDLSKSSYLPLGKWPPGYSLILAPVYFIVKDLQASTIVLQVLSIVLFFIVYLALLKQLKVSFPFICILVLFQGVTFYQDVLTSAPTDLLATAFCLLACLKAIEINEQSDKSALSFSIANCITATLRYMYWPISLVLPLFLLWNGMKRKDAALYKKGWVSLSLAAATCLGLYLYEKLYVGDTLYLNPTEKGVFLSNLLSAYPFTLATVLNLDFYAQQLANVFRVNYTTWMTVFKVVHCLIFLPLCFFFIRKLWMAKGVATQKRESFIFIVGIVSCTILALLAFLSVRISRYYPPPNSVVWTYLSDGRYYIFVLVTLPLVVYLYLVSSKKVFAYKKILSTAFVTLILLETVHGLYFTFKIIGDLHPKQGSYQMQKLAAPYIKLVIDSDKSRNITTVIASHMPSFSHTANFYGGTGLFDTKLLLQGEMRTTRPVHLMLFTSGRNLGYYKSFIERPGTKLENKINNLYCFGTYIYPQN